MSPRSAERRGAQRVTARQLTGSWALRRWQIVHPDGTRSEPYGAGAAGLLLYAPDGWMSACIMSAARKPLSHSNPRRASDAERAAAFDGYFSYAGRWRLADAHTVVHEVAVALNPASVGTLQFRDARLTTRTLTLSASEQSAGGLRTHRLTWARPRAARPSKDQR
jgi:hypothetical protein